MLLLRSFRLNITAQVGSLTEKKAQKVQEVLGKDFPVVSGIDNHSAALINPSKQAVLVLTPPQITFGLDGENIEPDFNYIKSVISMTMEALLLDPFGKAGVHIVGNYPFNKSTMDDSFKYLNVTKEELRSGIAGIR